MIVNVPLLANDHVASMPQVPESTIETPHAVVGTMAASISTVISKLTILLCI